jgi:hypothetical protein
MDVRIIPECTEPVIAAGFDPSAPGRFAAGQHPNVCWRWRLAVCGTLRACHVM